MMKKIAYALILALTIFNSTPSLASKMEKFLKIREELYQLRNDGLAAVPLFNIINKSKRAKEFRRKYKYLRKMINSPDLSQRERNRMLQLMRFDRVSNFSPKNSGHGMKGDFYTTPYGIKISNSCFKLLEQVAKADRSTPMKDESRQRVFEMFSQAIRDRGLEHVDEIISRQIERSIDKVIQCGENYPYAKKFTDKWIKSLKKTEFHCEEEVSSESGKYAYAIDDFFTPLMNKKIIFSSDSFFNFILDQDYKDEGYTDSRNTFIHEVFHLSQTDNRMVWHHNSKAKFFSDSCDVRDRVTDRVYLLGTMCSGQKYNITDSKILDPSKEYYMDELMAAKVKQCGLHKGCVRHFSDGMNSKAEAVKFCKNIADMGTCRAEESTRPISMERSKQIILSKLVLNIKNEFSKCKAYLSQGYQSSKSVKRPSGCPSINYLMKPANFPLSGIYSLSYSGNLTDIAYEIFNFTSMKLLRNHPKTNWMLTSGEWDILLEYFRVSSYSGRTKLCSEKIKINSTVLKMKKPISLKVEACKLPR